MKIVVLSHGKFAKGAVEALGMIMGTTDNVEYISMLDDVTEFEQKVAETVKGEEVIYLADLVGGHPFNTSFRNAMENKDKKQFVIGGFNLAALIEVVMLSNSNDIEQIYKSSQILEASSTKILANWDM